MSNYTRERDWPTSTTSEAEQVAEAVSNMGKIQYPHKLADPTEGPLEASAMNIAEGGCTTGNGWDGTGITLPTNPPKSIGVPEPKASLDLYLIWVLSGSGVSLVDAWDQDSVADNRPGWDEAVEDAFADHGANNVRVTITSVDIDAVQRAFAPPRV